MTFTKGDKTSDTLTACFSIIKMPQSSLKEHLIYHKHHFCEKFAVKDKNQRPKIKINYISNCFSTEFVAGLVSPELSILLLVKTLHAVLRQKF